MPPTRRRRPVQPATRVRLPRAGRPQPAAPNGTVEAGPAEAKADEAGAATAQTDVAEADARLDEVADEAADEAGEPGKPDEPDEPGADEPGREPLLLPVCLGVVTVLLGGLAIWFGVNNGSGTSSGFGTGGANSALTDTAATNQVNQQIDNAVDTIFSYNYTDTAKTAQAAKALLTGKASGEYAALFKVVQQDAPAEKLVLTTTVTNSGVEMLNGNTARLLIFANQKDTGSAKGSTTDAGAMFAVTAVRQGSQWKIEDINTFGGTG
jgi:Mce-associated membrane protein